MLQTKNRESEVVEFYVVEPTNEICKSFVNMKQLFMN